MIEPQQPEGGLVPNPHKEYVNAECLYEDWLEDDHRKERFCEDLRHSGFQEGSQVQLAHDKATMVKLPSVETAAEILRGVTVNCCGELELVEDAPQELLRSLGEKP